MIGFAKSRKILRSPIMTPETTASGTSKTQPKGEESTSTITRTAAEKAAEMAKALDDFVQLRNNIHKDVKVKATQLRKQMAFVVAELKRWKEKAERAEKALGEMGSKPITQPTPVATPIGGKRCRTPSETQKSPTGESVRARKLAKTGDPKSMEWSRVVGRSNAKKAKADKPNGSQSKPKEKPKRTELKRAKADALLIGMSEGGSHADIIRKVRSDPKLKSLGEKVVRIRRTQKGDMLFELQRTQESKVRRSRRC